MMAPLTVPGLTLRHGYINDPASFQALADLLKDTFEIDIGLLDNFGGPDPSAMPFGYFDDAGRCVANFSAVSMPLIINGRAVRAVGYQSGAVRPDYRGLGLYRDLMRRAFAWAEEQAFELGILLTDKPGLYEPYGFRAVRQHEFWGSAPKAATVAPARLLTPDSAEDVALIRGMLARRQPVSEVFAIAGHAVEFLLNACFDPGIRLSYLPDSDAIAAWKQTDGEFSLLDIVADEVPALASIVGALGVSQQEITVCFPPDRLDWPQGRPQPYVGSCDLMIAGMKEDVRPRGPFMLSPMAEF